MHRCHSLLEIPLPDPFFALLARYLFFLDGLHHAFGNDLAGMQGLFGLPLAAGLSRASLGLFGPIHVASFPDPVSSKPRACLAQGPERGFAKDPGPDPSPSTQPR